jgi:hypothetical protein
VRRLTVSRSPCKHTPPFRFARTSSLTEVETDPGLYTKPAYACCAPSKSQLSSLKRHAKLSELDSHLYCSIIGTCRSTSELRRLVPKVTPLDRRSATDLEIHDAAVGLAHAMTVSTDPTGAERTSLAELSGKRVVYVGGRPGSNTVLRRFVESAGGDFSVHDGGIEDRKGAFAAALPKADFVVFPVDCVDHASVDLLKRVCDRHQVDYHPVRTASVASFIELIVRLGQACREKARHPPSGSA